MAAAMSDEYVLGFLFHENRRRRVILLKKVRPSWQAGRLNAPGGRVEQVDLDIPSRAVQREFEEETGVLISVEDVAD
jgi:8-oxo-dGTP diphosphatase